MSGLRFSIDDSRWKAKLAKLRGRVKAKAFEAELRSFTKSVLATSSRLTPVRSLAVIQANQAKQYDHRVNYIPSYHSEEEPTLIVRDGIHWLHAFGKWHKANEWRLSDEVWSVYQQLLAERDRRLTTRIKGFISRRAQARFLYRRSWWQVGQSIGIVIPLSGEARNSVSRHNPAKSPPRGYAQVRGGIDTLSIVIYNPFLEQPSEYKPFSGRAILRDSTVRHQPEFMISVETKLRGICASV